MTEPGFTGIVRTVRHFADDFLPASFDDHCEFCARRLRFGECEFCDAN